MSQPGILCNRSGYPTRMPDNRETETDANRLIRIGNEAQTQQGSRFAHWEALARQMLGDEKDPKAPKKPK